MFLFYVYKFKSTKWAYLKKILVEKETLETWAVFSMEKGGVFIWDYVVIHLIQWMETLQGVSWPLT